MRRTLLAHCWDSRMQLEVIVFCKALHDEHGVTWANEEPSAAMIWAMVPDHIYNIVFRDSTRNSIRNLCYTVYTIL